MFLVPTGSHPVMPKHFGFSQRDGRIDRCGMGFVRWEPGQDKWDAITGANREIGNRRKPFTMRFDRGAQVERIGSGDRFEDMIDSATCFQDWPASRWRWRTRPSFHTE